MSFSDRKWLSPEVGNGYIRSKQEGRRTANVYRVNDFEKTWSDSGLDRRCRSDARASGLFIWDLGKYSMCNDSVQMGCCGDTRVEIEGILGNRRSGTTELEVIL